MVSVGSAFGGVVEDTAAVRLEVSGAGSDGNGGWGFFNISMHLAVAVFGHIDNLSGSASNLSLFLVLQVPSWAVYG